MNLRANNSKGSLLLLDVVGPDKETVSQRELRKRATQQELWSLNVATEPGESVPQSVLHSFSICYSTGGWSTGMWTRSSLQDTDRQRGARTIRDIDQDLEGLLVPWLTFFFFFLQQKPLFIY